MLAAADYREKMLSSLDRLPVLSPIVTRLLGTLAHFDVDYRQIGGLIEKDAVLCAHVLRAVNSALYARDRNIDTIDRAVSLLGISKLRKIALSFSVGRIFKRTGMPGNWSNSRFSLHSAATGLLCELIAGEIAVADGNAAFAAGLLHDIGKFVIAAHLPEQYETIGKLYTSGGRSLIECERAVLKTDHAELSGLALARWELPASIQRAVLYHHTPNDCPGSESDAGRVPLTCVINQADAFVHFLGIVAEPASPEPADPYTIEFPGQDFDRSAVLKHFELEWKELFEFFR
jgi:HD-like signal output (HDOD) protein